MVSTVLKHGRHWDFLAEMFKMKAATFDRTVVSFVEAIEPFLYTACVEKWAERFSMDRLVAEKTVFKYHKHARYATDVTFQQSNRPGDNRDESKSCFIGKHKLYGYKTEVSVLPNSLEINFTPHRPGSVSDLAVLRENVAFHPLALRKRDREEENYLDMGALADEFEGLWALIVDKGYQGVEEILRAIVPKRKPRNGTLTGEDECRNKKISSFRLIVENFAGRLCTLWMVVGIKYR